MPIDAADRPCHIFLVSDRERRLDVVRRAIAVRPALRLMLALLSLLLVQAILLDQARGNTRGVALVIGNSGYAERPLINPANDATDMASALREARFDVIHRQNLSEEAMKEAIAEFEDRLRAQRGVGVFYFAGHGTQTQRGRNYLLPVGRTYRSERDVELFGVAADAVLSVMENAGNRLNIVILDACRDAPLPSETRGGASKGLARMEAPRGSLIAFATATGRTASDNPGQRNGLYTHHLLRALRTPGLRLEDVFKVVGSAVERDSGGSQSPEEFMKLRDLTPFCFSDGTGCGLARTESSAPAPAPAAVVAATTSASIDTAARRAGEKVTFATDLFSAHGKATVEPAFAARLDDLVKKMGGINLEVILAVGHSATDEGDSAAAQKLSVRRAEAVKEYLVSRGIERNRIYTQGKGSSQPMSENTTPQGRAKNRRVEVEAVGTRPKS